MPGARWLAKTKTKTSGGMGWRHFTPLFTVLQYSTSAVDRWNVEARRGQARTRRCDWAGRDGVGWGGIGAASAGQGEDRVVFLPQR